MTTRLDDQIAGHGDVTAAGSPSLTPPQLDKLVISQLGLLAQRRLARGVKLNKSEATVCIDAYYVVIESLLTPLGPHCKQPPRGTFPACTRACDSSLKAHSLSAMAITRSPTSWPLARRCWAVVTCSRPWLPACKS